jgi:hypothetical protein
VETGDRLTARISAECGINRAYVEKIVLELVKNDYDWEQGIDWKVICEEVADHPTTDAFEGAILKHAPGAYDFLVLHATKEYLKDKENRLDELLKDHCGMATLLKYIYEGDPSKTYNNKNKKDLATLKEKALSRTDLLAQIKRGDCGNGKLKRYVNDLLVHSAMDEEEVDDVLREMEGNTAVSGEVLTGGWIKELGGFEFQKKRRVKEILRLLGDRYKLTFVEDQDSGKTLAVFKPRASGMEEVSAKDIKKNEDWVISPDGTMSVMGETVPYTSVYEGPQPKRSISSDLKHIPVKIMLKGKAIPRKAAHMGKEALKSEGKLILRDIKKWWTGVEPKSNKEKRKEKAEDEYRAELADLREKLRKGDITDTRYYYLRQALREEREEEED